MEGRSEATFQKLLNDTNLNDFVIKCDREDYHMHRVVLISHSQYFETLFERGC